MRALQRELDRIEPEIRSLQARHQAIARELQSLRAAAAADSAGRQPRGGRRLVALGHPKTRLSEARGSRSPPPPCVAPRRGSRDRARCALSCRAVRRSPRTPTRAQADTQAKAAAWTPVDCTGDFACKRRGRAVRRHVITRLRASASGPTSSVCDPPFDRRPAVADATSQPQVRNVVEPGLRVDPGTSHPQSVGEFVGRHQLVPLGPGSRSAALRRQHIDESQLAWRARLHASVTRLSQAWRVGRIPLGQISKTRFLCK